MNSLTRKYPKDALDTTKRERLTPFFVGVPIIHGTRDSALVVSALILSTLVSVILNKKFNRGISFTELAMLSGIGNGIGFFIGAAIKTIPGIVGTDEYSPKGIAISFCFAVFGSLILNYFAVVKGYFKKQQT